MYSIHATILTMRGCVPWFGGQTPELRYSCSDIEKNNVQAGRLACISKPPKAFRAGTKSARVTDAGPYVVAPRGIMFSCDMDCKES